MARPLLTTVYFLLLLFRLAQTEHTATRAFVCHVDIDIFSGKIAALCKVEIPFLADAPVTVYKYITLPPLSPS